MDQECVTNCFEPCYFFNNENVPLRIWNNKTWHIIAEAKVDFQRDVFQKVIERWTKEVHLIIPPIEYAEIINDTGLESSDTECKELHEESLIIKPTRTILRRLIPKRKDKDDELEELIEYYECISESRVVYSPIIKSSQESAEVNIPFYYPKVSCLSYVYSEYKRVYNTDTADYNGIDDNDYQSWIYIEIVPLTSFSNMLHTTDKMKYAYTQLFKKLFKWCHNTSIGYQKRVHHDLLVPKDLYMQTYQYLKGKYAKELVRNWTEKTDPAKFVFEDIAIASWLISLWKLEREENFQTRLQSFVDLGCGNGLLTFLLTSEGHEGVGIDVRKRKIWDVFQNKGAKLIVETLQPNVVTYPDVDWIIGNHADELVPWIPIIAARSSDNANFMVIPCCFFALSGSKYTFEKQIISSGKYKAYQEYIHEIIYKCGFIVEYDWLRIPSTKNVAMVGRKRKSNNQDQIDELLQSIGSGIMLRLDL
ncbi:2640_t:CDS:10 [Cetraspora pellucida]|uniref:tRNA (uracil-O(2)-)-methyltransferase n=1 Tax=Cetraspora pellucida TaxID=1433469 RepID=A0A9N9D0S1_9GLOM|nr:2640_t:CDS:10 [Cetraspora pellucida]